MVDPAKIRKARGTRTQHQYATAVGTDFMQVSRWERGDTQPGLESLRKLANEANQPIEWFLKDDEWPEERGVDLQAREDDQYRGWS